MPDAAPLTRIATTRVGGVAVLTLASDKVNSLDVEVLGEISAVVEAWEVDPGVRALVLTGEGRAFSAGVNVTQVLAHEVAYTDELLDALSATFTRLFRFPKPTVAAVNGSAIAGGCLLAVTCDKRLIADGAKIGVTELSVGVAFPVMTVELLRHVVGDRAEQLMFDASLLTADEACRLGLAHRAVPADELQAAALSAAEGLASHDAGAYALAKAASRKSALAAMDAGGAIDRQVHEQWRSDGTRAGLERLLAPRG